MTIAQNQVIKALSTYIFEEVWNEPLLEYVDNIALISVAPRFIQNWIIGNRYIPLPTTNVQYAVYRFDYVDLEGSLIIPKNTWVLTSDIATQYQTLFHVYSSSGQMLPKGFVYLYYHGQSNLVYVAIQKAPFLTILGLTQWTNLFISVYRYLQVSGTPQMTCQSFYIPTPDTANTITTQVLNAISVAKAQTSSGVNVYVNGYDLPTSATITVAPGDYVDIITDLTVIGCYSVDMSSTTETGYLSTLYNTYKNVLHTPKTLNPNNNIITIELVTLVARRNSDNVGLYIPKSETNSLTQITHNDFGLNTDIITAMRNNLGNQDISIEVKIRSHNKSVIREIDYIDYLYTCSDAVILQFLIGQGDASLPFWQASVLEASPYVSYMFNPPNVTTASLGEIITGLGYYTVISVLCQHLTNYLVTGAIGYLAVPKPLILSGLEAYPIAYINGSKVPATQIGYTTNRHDEVLVSFGSNVYYTAGQTVSIDVIEAGSSIPYIFTPSAETPTLTVPFLSVNVYQLNTLQTPVTGYQTSSPVSCATQLVQPSGPIQSYAVDTGTEIVFASSCYGNIYIIQNGTFSVCQTTDISAQVTAGLPLNVTLTTLCSDQLTEIPLIGYKTLDVYLNGKHLIANIDYAANPYMDENNNVALIQIFISNMEFITQTSGLTNIVEVIARTGSLENEQIGYVANNKAGLANNVEFWYAGLSEVFMNGLFQTNLSDDGTYLSPTPAIDNGVPFHIESIIPNLISDVLSGYSSSLDDSRITAINAYLNATLPTNDTSTLIIPNSWKLYSPYLTAIYAAVEEQSANGQLTLFSNDPDDTTFLSQFAAWDYLQQNDPTVNTSISQIDLRFCDINPSYATVTVPDSNTYAIMQRLTELILTQDPNTLGDVTDG